MAAVCTMHLISPPSLTRNNAKVWAKIRRLYSPLSPGQFFGAGAPARNAPFSTHYYRRIY